MVETVKVSIYCNFDFQSFPFDDHECDLSLYDPINSRDWTTMASEYEVNDICYKNKNCKWLSEEGWLYLPDGSPYTIKMRYMGANYSDVDEDHYDPVSVSTIKFSIKRNSLGQLFGSFYLPTGLFAFLSVGSYIINPDIVSKMYKDYII